MTARNNPAVCKAIAGIDPGAWTPIRYPNAVWDEAEQRLVSDAEVAEVGFTAFTSRPRAEQVTARLIVRRVRRLNPDTVTSGQGKLFGAHRHHAVFTDSQLSMLDAEATHRDHAIVEQVIADLKSSALAHLPSVGSPPTPPGPCSPRSRSTSPAPPARRPQPSTPRPGPRPSAGS